MSKYNIQWWWQHCLILISTGSQMWEVLLSNITLFEKGSKCLSDSPNCSFIQTFRPIRPQDTLEDSALVPENTLPMLAGPCLPSWLFLLRNFFDLAMCTFYCFKLHIWLSVYVELWLQTNRKNQTLWICCGVRDGNGASLVRVMVNLPFPALHLPHPNLTRLWQVAGMWYQNSPCDGYESS